MDSISLIIKNLMEKKITQDQAEKYFLKLLADASKKTADYELSFEMINDLTKAKTINKVIDTIFQIFSRLFSPTNIIYISIKENEVEYVKSPESFIAIEKALIEQLIRIKGNYYTSEYMNGFIIKIKHQKHVLAYLKIDGILFPEYKDRYINIALVLARVFGLAISNAQLFEALNKAILDLKRSNKDLEEFAYISSHDLKQPLTSIIMNFEILKKVLNGKTNLNPLEIINNGKKNAFKLSYMIDSLLKYARVGYNSKNRTTIDCNQLIDNVKENLKTIIQENQATIKNGKLPIVFANEIDIIQLFQNLIDNGIKYRGKDSPIIEINAIKKGKAWLFSVKDNGIGIKSSDYEYIFTMFHRVGDTELYEGSGIGLSICKKIVNNLGGKIWLDSEIGKGTTFCFTIPIAEEFSLENVKSPQKSSN